MTNNFEKLKVFNEAHSLVILIYQLTANFPSFELFGLSAQLRRSSVSIVANIVEGQARQHKKEFLQFLYMSRGSLEETKYHILLAKDLDYVNLSKYQTVQEKAEIVGKMLSGLIKSQEHH